MRIYKESPDNVTIDGKRKAWYDEDAVCFSLTHGVCIYLEQKVANEKLKPHPATHDYVMMALLHLFDNAEQAMQDLDKEGIKVIGSINQLNKSILQPLFGDKNNLTFSRQKSLVRLPNLIHGRVWYDNPKVVSFWNKYTDAVQYKNEVFELLKKFGDPQDFLFNSDHGYRDSYQEFTTGIRDPTPFSAKKVEAPTPNPVQNDKMSPLKRDVLALASKGFKEWLKNN